MQSHEKITMNISFPKDGICLTLANKKEFLLLEINDSLGVLSQRTLKV